MTASRPRRRRGASTPRSLGPAGGHDLDVARLDVRRDERERARRLLLELDALRALHGVTSSIVIVAAASPGGSARRPR